MRLYICFGISLLLFLGASCSLPSDKSVRSIKENKGLDSTERALQILCIENGIWVEVKNGKVQTDSILAARAKYYYKTGKMKK